MSSAEPAPAPAASPGTIDDRAGPRLSFSSIFRRMSSSTDALAFTPALTPADPRAEQELAWIGDAILALWARERILRELGRLDTGAFLRLTANEHLAGIARPTQVEAEIGIIYRRDGLVAAFSYIEARLLPMFKRQEANRRRQRR